MRSSSILPRTEGTGLRARWIRLFEPLLGLLIVGEAATGAAASRFTEYPVPTPFSGLGSIAAGPDANLWFTGSDNAGNNIGRITTVGIITEYPIPTADSGSYGMAAGPDRRVWFTELVANKIGAIRPSTASPRT